ncbi:hypothetical protein EI94DRAFT_1728501 [Lactarius quietus]|nr:hypothetical protein EI94DRAFT_1728501 [Lactarius quietus]
MSSSVSALFQPLRVGNSDLQHRVVMARSTRLRANKDHVHGIWNAEQIAGWKAVTGAVHANGSYIFLQIWPPDEGGFDLVGASPLPLPKGGPHSSGGEEVIPRELTVSELTECAELHSKASRNAIEAGFDGVEIHAANGYLLDQFLQTVTNERKDEYGGSVDNRVRFPLQVIKAIVDTIGAEGLPFIGMGMKDPLPTFTTLVERVRDAHPNLAYIHSDPTDENVTQSNEVFRKIWGDRPYIAAGGVDRAAAIKMVEKYGGLVAFGRHFIANASSGSPFAPEEGHSLTHYNRDTFYATEAAAGYIDYPFANNIVALRA